MSLPPRTRQAARERLLDLTSISLSDPWASQSASRGSPFGTIWPTRCTAVLHTEARAESQIRGAAVLVALQHAHRSDAAADDKARDAG